MKNQIELSSDPGNQQGWDNPDQRRIPSSSLRGAEAKPHGGSSEFVIGVASDPGRIRDRNEDSILALQLVLGQHGLPALPLGLFILADGMGGHVEGQQASALAVRLAARHILNHIYLPLLVEEGLVERAPINEVLHDSMRIAHEALLRRLPKAGTTMSLAFALGDGVYIAHVGDSRIYLGELGRMRSLTRDHSMAARLLEMGSATPDEARLQRNVLYKALGQGTEIDPDILYHDLDPGQYLLLCSDGLWSKISDKEMLGIIETSPIPSIACQRLVERANQNGGEDNISVILAARGWARSGHSLQA
jgi:serine/threonine protein phosphatase PrpC